MWVCISVMLILALLIKGKEIAELGKALYAKAVNLMDSVELATQRTDDFIEVVTSVAVGTIISIMTIALPVIISVVYNLTERYKTNYIVALFKNYTLKKFAICLGISLFASIAWVLCFLYWNKALGHFTILLFIATLIAVVGLLGLILRMMNFMTPDTLFLIIKKKIKELSAPYYYFDSNVYNPFLFKYGSKQEHDRATKLRCIKEYDTKSSQLYTLMAHLFVLFEEDASLHEDIKNFWQDLCWSASKIESDTKWYTSCYYNYMYTLIDWANEHNSIKLQEESVSALSGLLYAHLGKPRKLGEPETDIHTRTYLLTWETFECMWKIMRRCVDCPNDDMFKSYWQIVNNFYLRKYEDINIKKQTNQQQDMINNEKLKYLTIQYLCCAYLFGSNKYHLVEYILNYSQQSNAAWSLIPNDANSLINRYLYVKQWYSDYSHKMHFSFTEDYNLFDEKIRINPIAQFAGMLLLIFAEDADGLKDMSIDREDEWNGIYLGQLYNVIEQTNNETEWVKYLHLESLLKQKKSILSKLKSLANFGSQAGDPIKFSKNVMAEKQPEASENIIKTLFKSLWSRIKSLVKIEIN